jgi:hypothetical protein
MRETCISLSIFTINALVPLHNKINALSKSGSITVVLILNLNIKNTPRVRHQWTRKHLDRFEPNILRCTHLEC